MARVSLLYINSRPTGAELLTTSSLFSSRIRTRLDSKVDGKDELSNQKAVALAVSC